MSPPRPRTTALAALIAALAAALTLALHARDFDPSRLHVHGAYGDQAGYVTTARLLADQGRLESGLVYPAFAAEPAWRPYMPGHYACLALAYRLAGYGVLPTLAPSLLAFCLVAAGLVVIGARLHGLLAGSLAAAAYLCVPANVAYAFTGMAESTFQAACVVAFAAFVCLPAAARPWAGALCLALPFLFRETAALLVLPMALLVDVDAHGPARWKRVGTLVGLSVVLLAALLLWQGASGRGSFPLASWVAEGRFNYRDATQTPPALSVGAWVSGLGANAARNASETVRQFRLAASDPAVASYAVTLVLALAAGVLGLVRRDAYALGVAALAVGVLLLLYATYDVKAHKGLRSTMFVLPFALSAVAGHVAREVGAARRRGRVVAVVVAGLLAAAFLGHRLTRRAGADMRRGDAASATAVQVLERLHADPTTLLLAPHEMIKQYAVEAYPTRVGFHPANDATLGILAGRFEIGTLVLPDPDKGTRLSLEALREAGLRRSLQRIGGERTGYLVWTRVP